MLQDEFSLHHQGRLVSAILFRCAVSCPTPSLQSLQLNITEYPYNVHQIVCDMLLWLLQQTDLSINIPIAYTWLQIILHILTCYKSGCSAEIFVNLFYFWTN